MGDNFNISQYHFEIFAVHRLIQNGKSTVLGMCVCVRVCVGVGVGVGGKCLNHFTIYTYFKMCELEESRRLEC